MKLYGITMETKVRAISVIFIVILIRWCQAWTCRQNDERCRQTNKKGPADRNRTGIAEGQQDWSWLCLVLMTHVFS